MRVVSRPVRAYASCITAAFFLLSIGLRTAELLHIKVENGAGQLIVNGRPFVILGGELGNSSSGTAKQADTIIPQVFASEALGRFNMPCLRCRT